MPKYDVVVSVATIRTKVVSVEVPEGKDGREAERIVRENPSLLDHAVNQREDKTQRVYAYPEGDPLARGPQTTSGPDFKAHRITV